MKMRPVDGGMASSESEQFRHCRNLPAAFADSDLRETTQTTFSPFSTRMRPSTFPTFPAPTMAILCIGSGGKITYHLLMVSSHITGIAMMKNSYLPDAKTPECEHNGHCWSTTAGFSSLEFKIMHQSLVVKLLHVFNNDSVQSIGNT